MQVILTRMTMALDIFFIALLCLANIVNGDSSAGQVSLLENTCKDPSYKIHVFSKSPLVIYISNFITAEERSHLQQVIAGTLTKSEIADEAGKEGGRQTQQSQSTPVPRDAMARCIETRVLEFQGLDTPRSHLEPLQLVQYGNGHSYDLHTDYFDAPAQTTAEVGGNRVSSFLAYVAASNVTGGGTNFPILDAPRTERWCEIIDCDEPWDAGVTFKPIPGNAIFWQNLLDNGKGDGSTIHTELPLTRGIKVALNIWTRQGPLGEEIRGNADL